MTKDQMKAIMKIVESNAEEVLDKYLSYELVRRIKSDILSGVQWDLANKEED